MENRRLDLFEVFFKLWKWRTFIITNVAIVTVITVIIVLLLPKSYLGRSVFFPPKETGFSSFAPFSPDLATIVGGIGLGGSFNVLNTQTILDSRSIRERLIDEFNLREEYGFSKDDPIEDVLEELENNYNYGIDMNGSVTIEILNRDPEKAADMCNYIVSKIDEILQKLETESAHANRVFIGHRLEESKGHLITAEENLLAFQKEHGVIEVPLQIQTSLNNLSVIQLQKLQIELELNSLKNIINAQHPVAQYYENRLKELNDLITKMTTGQFDTSEITSLNLEVVPEIAIEYSRFLREIAIAETIVQFLTPQYEQSKIDEVRDTPVIQVIDYAKPAEKKYRPLRSLIVLLASSITLAVSILIVFLIDYIQAQKEKNPGRYEQLLEIGKKIRFIK